MRKSFATGQIWRDQHGREWYIVDIGQNPGGVWEIRARCRTLINHMRTFGLFDRNGYEAERDITLEQRIS